MTSDFPAPGRATRLACPHGSADALALARAARARRSLVVFTENAWHAQRLAEEVHWFAPELSVHLLPDWETLPYDTFSPHQDLVSGRLETLYQLSRGACDVAIIPVTTALYRLAPLNYLAAHTFFLRRGQAVDLDALRGQLTLAGYSHVTQVLKPGEYCVRGGLIDLFPMGTPVPYRIDMMDRDIDTIRTFDVDTQRSIYPVPEIRLLPAREFPLDEAGRSRFRENWRERFEGDPSRSTLYKDVSNGITPGGIEYYLPLFFDETATILDYLPQDAAVCLHHDVHQAAADFWRDARSRHALLAGDRTRPVLPPKALFMEEDAFFGGLRPRARLELRATSADGERTALPTAAVPDVAVDRRADDPVAGLRAFVDGFDGRVVLVAESLGRRETLLQMLREFGLPAAPADDFALAIDHAEHFVVAIGPLGHGFILPGERLALLTEQDLYASQVRQSRRRDTRRSSSDTMLRDLAEVRVGDPVVHIQHGVGRFLGLVNLDLGEGTTEFLHLQYADDTRLYVPVAQLHQISRYTGGPPESAPLHRLGSGQWDRAKRRAAQQVRDTAAELLHLYAQRAARQGSACPIRPHDYETFATAFAFEETPDQTAAIEAVKADMQSGRPMDRLICGDVGFGKTEVAMRAAFLAVNAGRQVAILVPTTLLAEQHFQNFSDRFAEWPVRLVELSRFRSAKEQAAGLQGLADGAVDIVIGTHKLLGKEVRFKNLGLVIIDEEHRFGVRQKERLKALRAEVDVLTLTATPIPRTLAMSLEGLRDFSVIATAPQKRLSIKTFVHGYSEAVVREAVLRELKRGGQVYFLYNEVETMGAMLERLTALLPEARIGVAHGQLRERELEHVMRNFYQQQYNVLMCSTIIETGIDVPTANTIIIHRADRFGLAQLHQLRGRVGRSHHQAYAYLLTPGEDGLSAQAKKRLEAIQAMEDLGAGFYLAMHDLEIRGAGEVLGESQSGEMQEIGFSLYLEMLDAAVKALRKGAPWDGADPVGATSEINLHAPALLPGDYCGDIHERLVLYKRLANCASLDDLEVLQEELTDRFGLPPEPAQTLLDCHRLRILSEPLGIAKIDANAEALTLQFIPNPPIEAARIIELIQTRRNFKLNGQDRLRVQVKAPTPAERAVQVRLVLKELSPRAEPATRTAARRA